MHKKLLKKFAIHPCSLLVASLFCTPCLVAHHEAIFGPQSTALISRKRFVSAQYYLSNEGRSPAAQTHSHIGVLSVGTSVGKQWSVAATLPLEAERGAAEDNATGMQDAVVALRYYPELGPDHWAIGVLTVERPRGISSTAPWESAGAGLRCGEGPLVGDCLRVGPNRIFSRRGRRARRSILLRYRISL